MAIISQMLWQPSFKKEQSLGCSIKPKIYFVIIRGNKVIVHNLTESARVREVLVANVKRWYILDFTVLILIHPDSLVLVLDDFLGPIYFPQDFSGLDFSMILIFQKMF